MKRLKKILVMAAAVLMLLTSLAGCSGNKLVGEWSTIGMSLKLNGNGVCEFGGMLGSYAQGLVDGVGGKMMWSEEGSDLVITGSAIGVESEIMRFTIISVDSSKLVLDMGGTELTLTKQ